MMNGRYRTVHGSEVIVYDHSYEVEFNWAEEENACIECESEMQDGYLVWDCQWHDGGSAELHRITEGAP